jgi:hypothetical protein
MRHSSNWQTVEIRFLSRMASSGMLHRVALVTIDVSEGFSSSIIRGDKNRRTRNNVCRN